MKVEETDKGLIRIHLPLDGPWYQIPRSEALQLAKDLLDACGEGEPETTVSVTEVLRFDEPIVESILFRGRLIVRTQHSVWEIFDDADLGLRNKLLTPEEIAVVRKEPDVFSGMSLDEIQEIASNMHVSWQTTDGNTRADLAFMIKELAARVKEQEPVRKTLETLMAECTWSLNNR